MKTFLLAIWGWITDVKDSILDASGKVKVSIIPIGSGLKIQDDKVVFDSENIEIDASKVNLPDASSTVKGVVKLDGTTIITGEDGAISANLPTAKIEEGVITLGENSITPLTSDDVEAFTDEEIEAIIAEVISEESGAEEEA